MLSPAHGSPSSRTEKELILATREFAVDDPRRSWWCLLSTCALFLALTVVAAVPIAWPIRLAASILIGLTHVRLFILYHDYQHGTILKNSKLASWIMNGYGIFALNPPSIWKRSHDYHHRNNSKALGAAIGSFPLMSKEAYQQASTWKRFVYRITRHPMTIGFGYLTIFLIGMCIRPFVCRPREHIDAGIAIALHATLIAVLLWYAPLAALLVIVLPNTIASALGAYLFYAQHNFPSVHIRERADWSYVDAALNSSSYMRMGPVMNWFTGNIGYHHVHHLNAKIPFYRLPEVMQKVPELQAPGATSFHPYDVIQCFRLKLWDRETGRLVTLGGKCLDPLAIGHEPTQAPH